MRSLKPHFDGVSSSDDLANKVKRKKSTNNQSLDSKESILIIFVSQSQESKILRHLE